MFVFWVLALVNAFVGSMVGLERTVLPLVAERDFALAAGTAVGAFVVAFSVAKAVVNLVAGAAADRWGRKRVLVVGWLVSLPVPVLLAFAPTWGVVIGANVLLGVGQALTWSMTLNMMIDVMPAHRRGFAAGINEFAGYAGLSLAAVATGWIAAETGLRPWPFALGVGLAAAGLVLSLAIRETGAAGRAPPLRWVRGVAVPSLLGGVVNGKDGLVWVALPVMLAARGLEVGAIGWVAGAYPFAWAVTQPLAGPWSDRVGRRFPIVLGFALQGVGLVGLAVAGGVGTALANALLLGVGTGLVYPVLIAAVADRVEAPERATALGIYRFVRDGGYAVGAIAAGLGLAAPAGWVGAAGVASVAVAMLAVVALRPGDRAAS